MRYSTDYLHISHVPMMKQQTSVSVIEDKAHTEHVQALQDTLVDVARIAFHQRLVELPDESADLLVDHGDVADDLDLLVDLREKAQDGELLRQVLELHLHRSHFRRMLVVDPELLEVREDDLLALMLNLMRWWVDGIGSGRCHVWASHRATDQEKRSRRGFF